MRKFIFLILAAGFTGCDAPPSTPSDAAPGAAPLATVTTPTTERSPVALSALQQEGRQIYEVVCSSCHGAAGRGDGPAVRSGGVTAPPTFHTQDYAGADIAALERRFRADIEAADPDDPHMQFVASLLQPERFAAALSYIPALVYPPDMPGSALAGQRIFDARCSGCHGKDGMGEGPAADALVTIKPANFTTDPLVAARDWEALFARIRDGGQEVHGSSMPPWGLILSDAEIWDLVAYLATFQEGLI